MSSESLDILLYHDVCARQEDLSSRASPRYTTVLSRLADHARGLAQSDYQSVRLGQWIETRGRSDRRPGRYCCLTFDGPHAGWFDHVIPLLTRLEVPATFYVVAGWLEDEHPYPESRGLSWDDVARLETYTDHTGRQLFDVGSHSMRHSPLVRQGGEQPEEYDRRLIDEIAVATELIRRRTGLAVRSYATPKGLGDLEAIRPLLARAGLSAVRWASLPGRTNRGDDDLLDLQISYCDTTDQSTRALAQRLSIAEPGPLKGLRHWVRKRICSLT